MAVMKVGAMRVIDKHYEDSVLSLMLDPGPKWVGSFCIASAAWLSFGSLLLRSTRRHKQGRHHPRTKMLYFKDFESE